MCYYIVGFYKWKRNICSNYVVNKFMESNYIS